MPYGDPGGEGGLAARGHSGVAQPGGNMSSGLGAQGSYGSGSNRNKAGWNQTQAQHAAAMNKSRRSVSDKYVGPSLTPPKKPKKTIVSRIPVTKTFKSIYDRIAPEESDFSNYYGNENMDDLGWLGDWNSPANWGVGGFGSPWDSSKDQSRLSQSLKDQSRLGGAPVSGKDQSQIPGYAYGGQMPPNQLGVVGEMGPELVQAGPGGANVIPNNGLLGHIKTAMPPTPPQPTTPPIRPPHPPRTPNPFQQSMMDWQNARPTQVPGQSPEDWRSAIMAWRGQRPTPPQRPPVDPAILAAHQARKLGQPGTLPGMPPRAPAAAPNFFNRPGQFNDNGFNWGSTNLARRYDGMPQRQPLTYPTAPVGG